MVHAFVLHGTIKICLGIMYYYETDCDRNAAGKSCEKKDLGRFNDHE
jgi:hypothetical protein